MSTVRELKVHGERDEVLLHARAGDVRQAAVGIGGLDEPPPGRVQLRDLEAEPVERFPQRLNVRSLQVIDLLLGDFWVVRHRRGVVERPSIPVDRMAASAHWPAATVVPVAATS